METTLKIAPMEYDVSGIDIVFKNQNGATLYFPWKDYDGTSVTFDVYDNGGLLNKNIVVSYTIMNESGKEISKSNTETNIKNAGEYTIKLEFTLLDGKNYKSIEPMEFYFEVDKAKYDTSKLNFESMTLEYDGRKHSLDVTFPKNLEGAKIDVAYQYVRGGEILLENDKNVTGVTEAGEYIVNAIFTVNDSNYEAIESMQATLVIEKKKISISEFDFDNTVSSQINKGENFSFKFNASSLEGIKLEAALYELEGDSLVEVTEAKAIMPNASSELNTASLDSGNYVCVVTVSIDDANYVLSNGNTAIEYYFNFEITD